MNQTCTADICATNDFQINYRVVNITAFITAAVFLVFLFSDYKWAVFLITIDGGLRAFKGMGKFAPTNMISNWILATLKVTPKIANGTSKIFASRIGFMMCIGASVFFVAGWPLYANIFAWMMVLFNLLDSFFSFCMGCQMYKAIQYISGRNKPADSEA